MPAWHLLRLLLHLVAGLLTCALVFPLAGPLRRETLVQRWSARLLRICGVQVRMRVLAGAQDQAPALIVANHVSWLDIFVINAHQPCRFVAKSDIRDWPLVGWLCEKAGTVFIARGRQRDVRRIFQGLVNSVRVGERVAFFPEGTTAACGTVLPFHANLFEAAIDAGVPVHPYALRYVDGEGRLHPAAEFIGDMSFAQSVMAILRRRDLVAEVSLLPPISSSGAHRRELASATRLAIAEAIGARLA
ncbi:MAG: 1-acyl-sn-glycerol-3-phosphate acyltransferase [Paucimonas sp.]|nr:1-acyl-sn-glycerol-3-phosphate acyltransferase [Paucimonas sp.]